MTDNAARNHYEGNGNALIVDVSYTKLGALVSSRCAETYRERYCLHGFNLRNPDTLLRIGKRLEDYRRKKTRRPRSQMMTAMRDRRGTTFYYLLLGGKGNVTARDVHHWAHSLQVSVGWLLGTESYGWETASQEEIENAVSTLEQQSALWSAADWEQYIRRLNTLIARRIPGKVPDQGT